MTKKKVKKRVKKRVKKLPRKLLFIPSSDKDFIERWDDMGYSADGTVRRDPLNIPASWRGVFVGKPGCGKSCMIKNIILRSRPKFERIYVLHQDKYAKEYNDIGAEVITELPSNDFWMGYEEKEEDTESDSSDLDQQQEEEKRPKTLVIIDDICFKDLGRNRDQTLRLDRLCGFISSHCNVSLAVLNQDVFAVNSIIRKCCNVWNIWRPSSTDQMNTIARRVGYRGKRFQELFDEHCPLEGDSLMIDMSSGSPFPLRKNAYELLEK